MPYNVRGRLLSWESVGGFLAALVRLWDRGWAAAAVPMPSAVLCTGCIWAELWGVGMLFLFSLAPSLSDRCL